MRVAAREESNSSMGLRLEDDLRLADARALLDRAVDKAEALGQKGTFVVADASGAPITAARMDGTGGAAFNLVRSKAFAAAANGETSYAFGTRMAQFPAGIFASYQRVMRENPFPGGGAVPITRNGRIVGSISTGLGIGPFVKLTGVDPSRLVVDGKPGNLEDIVISYAVGGDDSPQHGDDMKRWVDSYGSPPDPEVKGTGLDPEPRACKQTALTNATIIADHVLALAADEGLRLSVAITDHRGDLIRIDRMDDGAPMGVDIAEQLAVAASNFRSRTVDITNSFDSFALAQIVAGARHKMMTFPGGAPLLANDGIRGAIGISGVNPPEAQRIADNAAAWHSQLSR